MSKSFCLRTSPPLIRYLVKHLNHKSFNDSNVKGQKFFGILNFPYEPLHLTIN